MSEVKWIKIVTDIFDDEKILLIEAMPERDALIVIWFKLLCFAGKQNNGGVFMLNERIPYTEEMFATIFRRPVNTVRLALKTFEQYGMIEIINETVTIPNWEKHQDLDRIQKGRENTRKRVAAFRERQRIAQKSADSDLKQECNAQCNADVTQAVTDVYGNVTPIERERERERDIKEIEKKKPASRFIPPSIDEVKAYCKERGNNVDAERFVDYYTSNGWRVGKNPMKDWKAAVRSWERHGWAGYGYGGEKQKPESDSSINPDDLAQLMNPHRG